MSEHLGPVLTEKDQIEAALRIRKKKFVEQTIKASTTELLDAKLELEEQDGWTLLRKNKTSYRLSKDKPLDEQLEDEVWSFLAQMQFNELSDGRFFKIATDPGTEPRQIDAFAKDDEVAIFVECTQCETPKAKRMGTKIERIESYREKISKSLFAHYGRTPKLKQGWIIATRNIEWSPADLKRAEQAKIIVLQDTQIDYYVKFTKLYKLAAKYQFLSHLFANETILGLDNVVPATKGSMGGVSFYNFLAKPTDLLKIAHVSHKASREIQDIETYQRMLQPKRLRDLAKYIDNGGQFPTNIVINVRSKKAMNFEPIGKKGGSEFGNLTLPNSYAAAMIIDGQHRLYGYAHSRRVLERIDDKSTLPVLAYENLPPTQEAKLFVDINCEQVRVPRNLLNEINATLYWDSEDFKLRVDALCSRVVMTLNSRKTSPFHDRIKMTNRDQTTLRCLTLTNFIDGLKESRFFGEEKTSGVVPGHLSDTSSTDLHKTLDRSVEILDGFFGPFASEIHWHWNYGNQKNEKENIIGYLATNEGIRALLRTFKEILTHIQNSSGIDIDAWDLDELKEKVDIFTTPILDVFKTAAFETIAHFRGRSGVKGVRTNAIIMQGFIHKQIEEFNPPGLAEYLDTIDEEGTKEAKELVGDLQRQMHQYVIYKLKEKYPNGEEWWYEGVPETVRTVCSQRREADRGAKDREQYLLTLDYLKIASHNWKGCFDEPFSFKKEGGKETKLEWIKELSKIRNITHHEEKWPATKEQVAFVRNTYKLVMERFIIPDS